MVRGITLYLWAVESELDALTLWQHSIPAIATGGADGWRDDWASYVMRFEKIYICQEPERPGEEMVKRIGAGVLNEAERLSQKAPEVLACRFPEATKDANALHRSVDGDQGRFHRAIQQLTGQANSVNELIKAAQGEGDEAERQRQEEERQRLLNMAQPLIEDPEVLHKAIHAAEDLGVVGERHNIGVLHLEMRSRAMSRPVNVEVNSPSSAGKTHVVHGALLLEDPSAYYEMTAGSEKALIYLAEPLQHRILYIQEPEGLAEGVGAAAIK